jgi:hypothetical protein
LKWKPALLNTVDFVIYSLQDIVYTIYTFKRGQLFFYDYFTPDEELKKHLEKHPISKEKYTIIECRFDPDWDTLVLKDENISRDNVTKRKGGWRFVRVRTDKNTPNDLGVVNKIIDSIKDDVKQEELVMLCSQFESNWKSREKDDQIRKETKKRKAQDEE